MAETLVEALERAGVGTYSAEYRGMVARDAEAILKVSARFASPEVKREVLRALLTERIDELKHRRSGGIADRVSFDLGTTASASSASIEADRLLETLAPLEAP